MFLVNSHWLQ